MAVIYKNEVVYASGKNEILSFESDFELTPDKKSNINIILSNAFANIREITFAGDGHINDFKLIFPSECKYKKILNEYTRNEYSDPWFYFYTNSGVVKIGRRKRVINIDWSNFPDPVTAEELFPEEKCTKGLHNIHADSLFTCKRYVEKILKEGNRSE